MTAVRFLSQDSRAEEPSLSITKWPEYHGEDPHQANYNFAEQYQIEYKNYFRQTVDRYLAERVKGINVDSIRNPSERRGNAGKGLAHLTSINTARQIADRVGMPYGYFISFCFEFGRLGGVRRILQPNQLVPTKTKPNPVWQSKLVDHIAELMQPGGPLGGYQPADWSTPPGCYALPGARNTSLPACGKCKFSAKCERGARQLLTEVNRRTEVSGKEHSYEGKAAVKAAFRNAKAALHMRDVRALAKKTRQE